MKHADWAWTGIACGVIVYEIYAAVCGAELLSEAVDRYRHKHPVLTLSAITVVAAHLARIIPHRFDPLHRLMSWH